MGRKTKIIGSTVWMDEKGKTKVMDAQTLNGGEQEDLSKGETKDIGCGVIFTAGKTKEKGKECER